MGEFGARKTNSVEKEPKIFINKRYSFKYKTNWFLILGLYAIYRKFISVLASKRNSLISSNIPVCMAPYCRQAEIM